MCVLFYSIKRNDLGIYYIYTNNFEIVYPLECPTVYANKHRVQPTCMRKSVKLSFCVCIVNGTLVNIVYVILLQCKI